MSGQEVKKSTYNESCKRYYLKHKEEVYEKQKPYKSAWRERNRETLNEKGKLYYQLNKERVRERYLSKKQLLQSPVILA